MSVVFLDTETTGLSHRSEQIFEIAIITDDGDEHVFHLEPDVETLRQMHPKAAEVNRYWQRTAEPGWRWDEPEEVAELVRMLLDGNHVVGAVPDFDARFLDELYDSWARPTPRWHYHLIDIETMAVGYIRSRMHLPDLKVDWCLVCGVATDEESGRNVCSDCEAVVTKLPWDSDALSARFDIEPPTDDERHTALGDARWVKRWYERLTGDTA